MLRSLFTTEDRIERACCPLTRFGDESNEEKQDEEADDHGENGNIRREDGHACLTGILIAYWHICQMGQKSSSCKWTKMKLCDCCSYDNIFCEKFHAVYGLK